MSMGRRRCRFTAGKPSRLNQPCLLFGYVQEGTDWKTWRYRTVAYRKILELEANKEAEPFTRKTEANGICTFWRETKPLKLSEDSPAALTAHTAVAVACALSGRRLSRSDERQVARYRHWNSVGDDKAPLVRRVDTRG